MKITDLAKYAFRWGSGIYLLARTTAKDDLWAAVLVLGAGFDYPRVLAEGIPIRSNIDLTDEHLNQLIAYIDWGSIDVLSLDDLFTSADPVSFAAIGTLESIMGDEGVFNPNTITYNDILMGRLFSLDGQDYKAVPSSSLAERGSKKFVLMLGDSVFIQEFRNENALLSHLNENGYTVK